MENSRFYKDLANGASLAGRYWNTGFSRDFCLSTGWAPHFPEKTLPGSDEISLKPPESCCDLAGRREASLFKGGGFYFCGRRNNWILLDDHAHKNMVGVVGVGDLIGVRVGIGDCCAPTRPPDPVVYPIPEIHFRSSTQPRCSSPGFSVCKLVTNMNMLTGKPFSGGAPRWSMIISLAVTHSSLSLVRPPRTTSRTTPPRPSALLRWEFPRVDPGPLVSPMAALDMP